LKIKRYFHVPHPHLPHPHLPHPHLPHPHLPRPHLPRPHGVLPHVLDQYIHSKWSHYLFQCGLAAVSLIFILLIGDTLLRAAIVVGVASSAFTIFVVPDSVAATPRKVIGGHFAAIVIAMIIIGILSIFGVQGYEGSSRFVVDVAAAMSVGIGIIVMVVTNTEHPPAAGTSLGLIIHSFDWTSIVFVIASVVLLSVIRMFLRGKMINLL